jgi:Ca2+-binding EF-hand superfamily protein
MQALLDLDDDGDGMIPKEEMTTYLSSMGEAFTHEEIKDFLTYATKAQPKVP